MLLRVGHILPVKPFERRGILNQEGKIVAELGGTAQLARLRGWRRGRKTAAARAAERGRDRNSGGSSGRGGSGGGEEMRRGEEDGTGGRRGGGSVG
jgi:hypothetical protein